MYFRRARDPGILRKDRFMWCTSESGGMGWTGASEKVERRIREVQVRYGEGIVLGGANEKEERYK